MSVKKVKIKTFLLMNINFKVILVKIKKTTGFSKNRVCLLLHKSRCKFM